MLDETPIFSLVSYDRPCLLPHNDGVPPAYAPMLPAREILAARTIAAATYTRAVLGWIMQH